MKWNFIKNIFKRNNPSEEDNTNENMDSSSDTYSDDKDSYIETKDVYHDNEIVEEHIIEKKPAGIDGDKKRNVIG